MAVTGTEEPPKVRGQAIITGVFIMGLLGAGAGAAWAAALWLSAGLGAQVRGLGHGGLCSADKPLIHSGSGGVVWHGLPIWFLAGCCGIDWRYGVAYSLFSIEY